MKIANKLFFSEVERRLSEGESVCIRMKGHSMRPLLREAKDSVVISPCRGRKLQCGDVVLFRQHNTHILHRIVAIEGSRLLLAGDGNYRIHERCCMDDVLGIMVQVIRPSGRVIECHGNKWQTWSRRWIATPAWLRRQILRVLWHLGIR